MTSKEIVSKYFSNKKTDIERAAEEAYYHGCTINFYGEIEEARKEYEIVMEDLEILEILKEHLYVATGLVELKITSQEYATMHKVKYHNGIPIVNQPAIDKINKWFYRRENNDK